MAPRKAPTWASAPLRMADLLKVAAVGQRDGVMRSDLLTAALLIWIMACPPALGENPREGADGLSLAAASKLYPLPGTKRVFLHRPADYKIVTARPDLKLQIKNATTGGGLHLTGYGFVLVGKDGLESFDFDRTRLRFEQNSLPLLCERVVQAGFVFEQTVFTTTDANDRPVVLLRLRIVPENDRSGHVLKLAWLTVRDAHGRFHSHSNEDYIVFEPWAPAWQSGLDLEFEGGVQHDGRVIFDAIRSSDNVSIVAGSRPKSPLELTVALDRRKEATIEVLIPYEGLQKPVGNADRNLCWQADKAFPLEQKDRLLALSFDAEYARQTRQWQHHLARAAQILVPEAAVVDIYRTLSLNNLQFLGSSPGCAWYKPGQGGFNGFSVVYGWESSHFLTVMDRQGFHDETRRVLDYFLTTQQGRHGPQGDISTAEGCFRPHIHWMCETGSILGIFAEHALSSGDVAGLRKDSVALVKAARWIQSQRARTKQLDAAGKKVPHYGLMPPGRATDWPDSGYFFWTDAYTWQGLDRLARAYQRAGLPEADWLRDEAADYHACILDAMRRSLKPHPLDASLLWFPDHVYEDPAKALPTTIYSGPKSLLGSGALEPNDPLAPAIEASLRRAGCMNDQFGFHMRTMEDAGLKRRQEQSAGGHVDLYYVNEPERAWHRIWLARGERIKALRYFYMTMAYSTSRDVHLTHERFCPQLAWLLPWQPNASGNGRVLEMILTSLCFEQGDAMCLLYGAPDAWFDAREPLGVTGLCTSCGRFSFRIEPRQQSGSYLLSYECEQPPPRFFLALPSGQGSQQRRIVEIPSRNLRKAACVVP